MFRVSQSKVKTWRKCRRAYHYKYIEKLVPRRISRPFQFGRIVHDMFQAYGNGDDPFETLDSIAASQGKLFDAEIEYYGDIIDDVRCIMTEYFEYHAHDLRYVRRAGRGTEHPFEIDIGDGLLFTGKIDAVARTATGGRWLVEHKTFTRLPSEDHRWRNLQSAVYIRAMEMLGWPPVDGTVWDYVFSKPPARPQLLKSGQMSRRGIDSLPSRVVDTLARHELSPDDFPDLMQAAVNNRKYYFPRVFNTVKPHVVQTVFQDFKVTGLEIKALHGERNERNIDRHCDYCEFEPICRADLQGSDVEFVKKREYHERSTS